MTHRCGLVGCEKMADEDIKVILAGQKVIYFCCFSHYREWKWPEKSDKVDARVY